MVDAADSKGRVLKLLLWQHSGLGESRSLGIDRNRSETSAWSQHRRQSLTTRKRGSYGLVVSAETSHTTDRLRPGAFRESMVTKGGILLDR